MDNEKQLTAQEILKESFRSAGMYGVDPLDPDEMGAIYSAMKKYGLQEFGEGYKKGAKWGYVEGYKCALEALKEAMPTFKDDDGPEKETSPKE